jgi:hypothetical protein
MSVVLLKVIVVEAMLRYCRLAVCEGLDIQMLCLEIDSQHALKETRTPTLWIELTHTMRRGARDWLKHDDFVFSEI